MAVFPLAMQDRCAGPVAPIAPPQPVPLTLAINGLFPIDVPGPDQLAELAAEIGPPRAGREDPFDLVVEVPPGADVRSWQTAGATWVLTSIEPQPSEREIREVIEAGP